MSYAVIESLYISTDMNKYSYLSLDSQFLLEFCNLLTKCRYFVVFIGLNILDFLTVQFALKPQYRFSNHEDY